MGTITKALDLLTFFSRARPEIGLGEFVRLTGRDKATVHRHLSELAQNGFLEQAGGTRAYRLGPALLRLTTVREATVPTRSVVLPIVEDLADRAGELVHFTLLQAEKLFPVCHADPARHGTQVHFDEAEDLPFHATASGLAALAFGPAYLREKILSEPLPTHTDRTLTDPAALVATISDVARTGVAVSERAFDREVTSRAVPVFGPDGLAAGALAIAMPATRMSDAREEEVRALLRSGMIRITQALGGVIPEDHPALAESAAR